MGKKLKPSKHKTLSTTTTTTNTAIIIHFPNNKSVYVVMVMVVVVAKTSVKNDRCASSSVYRHTPDLAAR